MPAILALRNGASNHDLATNMMTSKPHKLPGNGPPGKELPGNDGSWFLEAIRADVVERAPSGQEEAPSPSAPAADNGTTTQVAPHVVEDPLKDFAPEQLDRRLDSARTWQWPFVILSAVIGIALVFAILWIPRANDQRASAKAAEYGDAFAELLSDLAPTQQALATLTDPTADVTSFGLLVAPITDFSADASAAVKLGSEPAPSPFPLASSQPFDRLPALQDALATYGAAGNGIARRLADLLDYRATFDSFLDVGALPSSAAEADVEVLATTLATTSVDSATILSLLPNDAALAEHKAAAEAVLVDFTEDQLGYLDALRTGDSGTAAAFVEALAEDRAQLQILMAEALRRLRSEIDESLVALSTDIAGALAAESTGSES